LKRKENLNVGWNPVDVTHFAISRGFAKFCREADAEYLAPKKPDQYRLPKSVLVSIDRLLDGTDDEMRNYLKGRPDEELRKIIRYIKWKKY
jgi:hypothetical protein